MNTRPIDEIIVSDNRQRREFDEDALESLAQSIESKGLMHPLVVRDDGRTLVAGERRLRAISRLHDRGRSFCCAGSEVPTGHVPYILLGNLSPLLLREAELEENVIRRDLTWQEHSNAVKELFDLRNAQAEERGAPPTSVRDITAEILGDTTRGYQDQQIAADLRIAEHLDDPDVAAAKTKKDALKVIEKKKAAEHRAELARQFGELKSEHQVIHGSAFDMLPKIQPRSIDIILTDPPYGVEAHNFGDQADARHTYQDDITFALECYALIFREAERICRPSAFIFAFCDIQVFPTLLDLGSQVSQSFSFWSTPLIWNKGNGMLPVPDRGPRRNYEAILYGYRGDRQWLTPGSSDVFEEPALSRPVFGAQKPPAIYSQLLSRVAQPGDVVLDPFGGTCPLIPAASDNSSRAVCIELDGDKINYAKAEYLT